MKYQLFKLNQQVVGLHAGIIKNDAVGAQIVIESGEVGIAVPVSEIVAFVNKAETDKQKEKEVKEEQDRREMENQST